MKDWQVKYGDFMDTAEKEEEEGVGGEGSQEDEEEQQSRNSDEQTGDSEIKLGSDTGTEAWGTQAEQSGRGWPINKVSILTRRIWLLIRTHYLKGWIRTKTPPPPP